MQQASDTQFVCLAIENDKIGLDLKPARGLLG